MAKTRPNYAKSTAGHLRPQNTRKRQSLSHNSPPSKDTLPKHLAHLTTSSSTICSSAQAALACSTS